MSRPNMLYIADANVDFPNGMLARQAQFLHNLSKSHKVTILNTWSSPQMTENWLDENKIQANVVKGLEAVIARLFIRAWYYLNIIICNKLGLIKNFIFPFKLNIKIFDNKPFDLLVFYYAWTPNLINIKNPCNRILVDTGDVMANRHERIKKKTWISLSLKDERNLLCSSGFEPLAITIEDSDEFYSLYGVRPKVLPYAPINDYKKEARGGYIGFLGAKNNFSLDFIKLLSESSLIESLAISGKKILLAGTVCSYIDESTLNSLQIRGVKIIGPVDSIFQFYSKVHTVFNLSGPSTGAKIKSIEALMLGKNLISTKFGIDEYSKKYFDNLITIVDWPLQLENLTNTICNIDDSISLDTHKYSHNYLRSVQKIFTDLLTHRDKI
ncbi:hypothetical protein N9N99_03705 [Gammaproteobacteria bacterium]|nr:hypothetical protein [Gammaproteobacteria bacterium]